MIGRAARALVLTAALLGGASAVMAHWQGEEENPVLVCPDGSPGTGCDQEDIQRAIPLSEDLPADIESRCLFRTAARCYPVAFGRILSVEQGRPLTWQHMVLFPDSGARTEMLVIAEGVTALDMHLLVARQTDGWFAPPRLVENSNELMVLHAEGRRAGSGAGRADVILSRHDQGWTTFSLNELLDQASAMLPAGFSLAGGASVDLSEMFVSVPVRRAGDGGCCPTGGTALIDLAMPEPNIMRVASVTFLETPQVNRRRIPRPEE